MRRARAGALIGVVAASVAFAIGLADCAEPTQIEIDVRTDACGVIKNAGIAVTSPDNVDDAPLTIFTPERPEGAKCEAPGDRVGTLIVYPSGSKDAEVGIRIVGGISRTAQDCKPGDYAGCVVARRVERFVAGSSKKVIVILSRACEGKDCGRGAECSAGQCVVELPDGGIAEAGPIEGGRPDDAASDAPFDAVGDVVDASQDACVACSGAGTACNGNKCNIDCSVYPGGCNKPVCGAGLDCTFGCNSVDACKGSSCMAGSLGCTFDCTNGNPACSDITCIAPSCLVKCSNGGRCAGSMTIGGGDAGLLCNGNMSCDAITGGTSCDAGNCYLKCDPSSCPSPKSCTSGQCPGDWNQ